MRAFASTLAVCLAFSSPVLAQYTPSTVGTLVRCNDYQSLKDQNCAGTGPSASTSCRQVTDMVNQYCSSVLGADGRVSQDKIQQVIANVSGGGGVATPASGTPEYKHLYEECKDKQQYLTRECSAAEDWTGANSTCSGSYSSFNSQCSSFPALAFTPPNLTAPGSGVTLKDCTAQQQFLVRECSDASHFYNAAGNCQARYSQFQNQCSEFMSQLPFTRPSNSGTGGGAGAGGVITPPPAGGDGPQPVGDCRTEYTRYVVSCGGPAGLISGEKEAKCKEQHAKYEQICATTTSTLPVNLPPEQGGPSGISPTADATVTQSCSAALADMTKLCNERSIVTTACENASRRKREMCDGVKIQIPTTHSDIRPLTAPVVNNTLYEECKTKYAIYANRCSEAELKTQVGSDALAMECTKMNEAYMNQCSALYTQQDTSALVTGDTRPASVTSVPTPVNGTDSRPELIGDTTTVAASRNTASVNTQTATAVTDTPVSQPGSNIDLKRPTDPALPSWGQLTTASQINTYSEKGTKERSAGSMPTTFTSQVGGSQNMVNSVGSKLEDRPGIHWVDPTTGESLNGKTRTAPASDYAISAPVQNSTGFTVLASSSGVDANSPADSRDLHVAYVTDRQNSDANNEYGFYQNRADATDPTAIHFYYSINTNVGNYAKDDNGKPVYQTTSAETIFSNVTNFEGKQDGPFFQTAYFAKDANGKDIFRVAIVDGNHPDLFATATVNGVRGAAVVDVPIEDWFPAEQMQNSTNYVVTGTQTIGSPNFSAGATTMQVGGIWTGGK